jgi:hypothetical protein
MTASQSGPLQSLSQIQLSPSCHQRDDRLSWS